MSGLQNNPQNNASPHSAEFSCAWAGDIPDSGGAGRDIYAAASCDSAWRNAAIRVGRDIDDAATRDFAGHLDDFRIYGRALAAGEALGLVSPVSTVSRQYVWGLYIDELLQQKNLIGGPSGGAAGQEAGGHYLMSDLLYRAAALVTPDSGEPSGVGVRILENYDFDAYGNTLIFNAPGTGDDWWASDAQQTPTPACRYLFTGREYDAESGLYYYRARFYWPELGRFGQRDPIGYVDSLSMYAYVGSNPIHRYDPLGLEKLPGAYGDRDTVHSNFNEHIKSEVVDSNGFYDTIRDVYKHKSGKGIADAKRRVVKNCTVVVELGHFERQYFLPRFDRRRMNPCSPCAHDEFNNRGRHAILSCHGNVFNSAGPDTIDGFPKIMSYIGNGEKPPYGERVGTRAGLFIADPKSTYTVHDEATYNAGRGLSQMAWEDLLEASWNSAIQQAKEMARTSCCFHIEVVFLCEGNDAFIEGHQDLVKMGKEGYCGRRAVIHNKLFGDPNMVMSQPNAYSESELNKPRTRSSRWAGE